jgi:2,4-diaminopentanoate dehydrogenase
MTYRVIQWATGFTGRKAVQAMAERPEYEIVGAFVYGADKAGRDLGEICDTRRLGVKTTSDRKQIIATPADCVIFMASAEMDLASSLRDVCDLLVSGKDVIATSTQFIYPKGLNAEFADTIARACEKGGSTFHGLGVMPGFVSEAVALMLTRLSRRIDQVVAYESLMYHLYPSHFQMFDCMGFGYEPDDPKPMFSNLEFVGHMWRPSAVLLADAAGIKVDEAQCFRDVVVATKDLQVASGLIRKGTVAAMNVGVRIISGGHPVIVMQHFTRMDADLAPEWPRGEGWTLVFEGVPSMSAKINVGIHGEDHTDQGCWTAAMNAVHAVPYVIAAKPGILSLADVPPVWGTDAFRKV